MSVGEQQRHQLHVTLESVIGPEGAATLMEYLPPVGWADVATKRDLDALADKWRAEMYRSQKSQTQTLVLAMLSTMLLGIFAVAGIAFGAG